MKTLLLITALSFCAATLSAQRPYHRPPGMPDNELVAFDDFKPSQETATLRSLLSIYSFRWMLQIPDHARSATVTISEYDTQSKTAKEVARFTFDTLPADPSRRDDRPKFFPVILTMMPDESTSDEPWRTSWSFLGLFEAPDLNVTIRRSYPNPFRQASGGLSIFNTTRIASPLPKKAGMWDGFGTAFDIMASGENDRYVMRISFITSTTLGER